MKSLFQLSLLLLALIACQSSWAQGNLQFNQAIFEQWTETIPTGSSSYYYITPDHTVTVPVGKVWKIESMNLSPVSTNAYLATTNTPSAMINGSLGSAAFLYLNETIVFSNADLSATGESMEKQIMWLPAGTYNYKMAVRRSISNVMTFNAVVTAIEFNVVP